MSTSTIADSLSQAELDTLEQAFRLAVIEHSDYVTDDERIESLMGFVTSEYLWDKMWRFGIVLDDDCEPVRRLGCLWQPEGRIETGYYVPDDVDTTVQLVELSGPARADALVPITVTS